MTARPNWISRESALSFDDADVARLYLLRPPYPDDLAPFLRSLTVDGPVLDVGCGPGSLAIALAPLVPRIDAIDISAAMIAVGRKQPGGEHSAIRWIVSDIETAPLDGPYGLAVAGQSLHWIDHDTVLPRVRAAMAPGAVLAIVSQEPETGVLRTPWHDSLMELIRKYSAYRNYRSCDLIESLTKRGVFRRIGTRVLGPVRFRRSVDDYVASFHAHSSLTRARIGAAAADAFDQELRRLVGRPYVDLEAPATVVWGELL